MTAETHQQFNDRRATEEKTLADLATDRVQSIPHEQLSKLHADAAETNGANGLVQDTALDVTAVDGAVTLAAAAGEAMALTPQAAFRTSDRLLARAHEAERQRSST